MNKIVQCVPNISEGIRQDIIDEILAPLQNQSNFQIVSVEPDQDYNRTVITLLGDPEAMLEPLVLFYQRAFERIDLSIHKGEHPRMGAVDVCPFIPIQGLDIQDCVEYAKQLSQMVSSVLPIPIFLYAKAATSVQREKLPDIRKGEYEGMFEKIKLPEWAPDYGIAENHPTFGATAIGARLPLIAYNIDLPTKDEKIASNIAKAIRASSGGFGFIQAGGALLLDRDHVQVTMNILDYKKNPMYRIFETVQMEAKRYQLEIKTAEIVGLLPKECLTDSLKYYFQCHQIPWKKDFTLDEIVSLSHEYLHLRDFTKAKIIEAYLDV